MAGTQGWVVVRYDISRDGRVMNARVDESEPTGIFDEAALKAVRSWRYNPQIKEGEVQAVSNVLTTVRFVLGSNDAYDNY